MNRYALKIFFHRYGQEDMFLKVKGSPQHPTNNVGTTVGDWIYFDVIGENEEDYTLAFPAHTIDHILFRNLA